MDGYQVKISVREDIFAPLSPQENKLFFVNLGGYQEGKFEEQHYMLLTVKPDRISAVQEAKRTLFYKHNHYGKAVSHIDDKYGIDVDDLYEIEDILSFRDKTDYAITLIPSEIAQRDALHLGYLKMNQLI